jgi:hypothetical protein
VDDFLRAAGVDDEAAQGDVQLHQEPAPGGGRPERPPLRPHGHHGPQQPRRRDHPQPPPLAIELTATAGHGDGSIHHQDGLGLA